MAKCLAHVSLGWTEMKENLSLSGPMSAKDGLDQAVTRGLEISLGDGGE